MAARSCSPGEAARSSQSKYNPEFQPRSNARMMSCCPPDRLGRKPKARKFHHCYRNKDASDVKRSSVGKRGADRPTFAGRAGHGDRGEPICAVLHTDGFPGIQPNLAFTISPLLLGTLTAR